MKKVLPTLAIGIPAYNEEGNIGYLLESILKQKATSYTIKEILVVCDGCTDNTVRIAKSYAKHNPYIKIINRGKRSGKAPALNYMYRSHSSDLFFQPDADVVLEKDNVLDLLVKRMLRDKRINLVSPQHIAVKGESFWATLAFYSYAIFSDAAMHLHKGKNVYTVMGASLIRGSYTKSFTYPDGIIGDQTYLFASVIHDNAHGYAFEKNAHVLFRTIGTFKEWRELGVRSTGADKLTVTERFENNIVKNYYSMPYSIYLQSMKTFLFSHPFITLATLAMEIYIRAFPLKHSSVKNGTWEPNRSSKIGIKITL